MNNIFEHDNDEGPLHDDTLLAPKNERFDRKSWNIFSIRGNAKSWRDETIPFEEIKIGNIIGRGRFGEVFEGFHLDITNVAIKFLDMNYVDESKRIEAFKRDTACIQSARHENLTYFFGFVFILLIRYSD
jgi:serine/threonine protein kinase